MPRVKTEFRQVSRENYKEFCEKNPDIDLSFSTFCEIVYKFNYYFRDQILETGDLITYPWGLGNFSIDKKKTKRTNIVNGKEYIILPIDWKKTNAARKENPNAKRVFLFNSHSDGYRFKWYWQVKTARFIFSDIFVFKPYRVASRLLAEKIKKPNSEYIDLYKKYNRK
jgi:hypothetical protein